MSHKSWSFTGWNKLHFASTQTFLYTKMFAVHDRAHKNCVIMSPLCTGANISAETLCQAVLKIQIRTNSQCLMSAIATFNSLFFKAIPCKLVQYWVSMSKLHTSFWERSLHVFKTFCFSCDRTIRFRMISKISTMPEPKENYT